MPASPSSGPTAALKTETTRAGTVLASSRGLTLYYYTADKPGSGKSVCTGGCATAWPPLAAPVKAPAGVHLPGPLGMITRPGGVKQVTLNGFPVYLYAGDKAPGQDTGNGIEGSWHVIKIHATAAAAGRATALKVERTRAGTVLASSRGLTLYYYSEDKPDSGKSACTGVCATAWPPLAAPVKAPRRRAPARPARRHHPAERRQAGHPQRLSPLLLRRRQGPRPGQRQRHRRLLARHQDQGLTARPMPRPSVRLWPHLEPDASLMHHTSRARALTARSSGHGEEPAQAPPGGQDDQPVAGREQVAAVR